MALYFAIGCGKRLEVRVEVCGPLCKYVTHVLGKISCRAHAGVPPCARRRAGRRQRCHPGGDLFHDRAVAAAGDFWGHARGWLGAAPVLAGVGPAVSGQINRTGAMS